MAIYTAAGLANEEQVNGNAFNKNGSIVTLKKISETDWLLFGDVAEGDSEGFISTPEPLYAFSVEAGSFEEDGITFVGYDPLKSMGTITGRSEHYIERFSVSSRSWDSVKTLEITMRNDSNPLTSSIWVKNVVSGSSTWVDFVGQEGGAEYYSYSAIGDPILDGFYEGGSYQFIINQEYIEGV